MTTAATIGAPSEKTHKPSHAIEADSDVRDLDLFSTIQEDLTEFRSQPNQDDESMFGVGDASLKSGLTSIASTIPDYVYENGRRYHSTSASNYVRFLPFAPHKKDGLFITIIPISVATLPWVLMKN